MKKHCTFLKKSLVLTAEMLAVLGMVGIIGLLFAKSVIVTDSGENGIFINPFEEKNYEASRCVSEMFNEDSANMIFYLALCQQFETEGKLDEQKTVDVLEYYYRRGVDSVSVNSAGKLVYKVQDLINWGKTYGVSVTGGAIDEAYTTKDGSSIYNMDLWTILNESLPGGVEGFELPSDDNTEEGESVDYDADEVVYIETEESADGEYQIIENHVSLEKAEEEYAYNERSAKECLKLFLEKTPALVTEEECQKGLDAVEFLKEENLLSEMVCQEIYADIAAEGSYAEDEIPFYCEYLKQIADRLDKEEKQSLAQAVYTEIMETVISDLSYNYELYQKYKEYFVNTQLNYKYLYLPENSNQYYTNLDVKSREQAEKMVPYFNDGLAAYAVIEPATRNIKDRSENAIAAYSLSTMLNQVFYSFEKEKGTIYLGVLDSSVEGFAEYTTQDYYAQAKDVCLDFENHMNAYMIVLAVLFVIALFFFCLYTCMCGNKAWYRTTGEEQKRILEVSKTPCAMKYFDNWFTEIAFCAGIAVAIFLLAVYLCGMSMLADSGDAFYVLTSKAVLIATILYAALCNGLFLFFYGSLVRRIKLGTLWKGSLAAFLLKKFKKWLSRIKVFLLEVYNRRGIFVKLILVYGSTLLGNIVLASLGVLCLEGSDNSLALFFYLLLIVFDTAFLYGVFQKKERTQQIVEGIEKISGGDLDFKLEEKKFRGDNLRLVHAVNNIGSGIKQAVETSMKDERLKADLITNVSHDIKTPLTSIISYVDLLKREEVADEKIRGYIEILDLKSQRLKQLTEDLVEASKISSGNITLLFERLGVKELMNQMIGEFSEKFAKKQLEIVTSFLDEDAAILADGRRMWRVFENLFGNIYKYAMPGTRVYVEVYKQQEKIFITIKNISEQPLNIAADELTERFIRGDISRSTEGSGLGLSIAKNLVAAQKGEFQIYLDGDLFKVTIALEQYSEMG